MLREKRLAEPQWVALRQDLQLFQAVLDGLGPPPKHCNETGSGGTDL